MVMNDDDANDKRWCCRRQEEAAHALCRYCTLFAFALSSSKTCRLSAFHTFLRRVHISLLVSVPAPRPRTSVGQGVRRLTRRLLVEELQHRVEDRLRSDVIAHESPLRGRHGVQRGGSQRLHELLRTSPQRERVQGAE